MAEQEFRELIRHERPQDPHGDGTGLLFETGEHGGGNPDNMPQAITVTDAGARRCVYVPLRRRAANGAVNDFGSIVLYAAGNSIGSIARGTLPLALFGPARYPVLMGRLGLPIMMAMAMAPFAGAVAFQVGGADWTLGMLATLAVLNAVLVAQLWRLSRTLGCS